MADHDSRYWAISTTYSTCPTSNRGVTVEVGSRCAAPRPARTRCAASQPSSTPAAPGAANAGSVARLEASTRGFDARYIVTSLGGEPRHLYEDIYCARGQAENLIKMHKGQLASDRTSCQSPLANQLRLVLHTATYWLMLALRDAIPRAAPLAHAEFATHRLRLL